MCKILVENLTFSYENGPYIIKNMNFSMEKEFVVVTGCNGCGKTTFFKLLLGMLKPVYGEIKVLCNNCTRKFDVLWQEFFYTDYTFRDLFEIFSSVDGNYLRYKERFKFYSRLFDTFSLLNSDFYYLSGGEKQRIMLTLVLSGTSPFLLLDEPLIHLDENYRNKFLDSIRKEKEEKGILIVTHHKDYFSFIMDRELRFYRNDEV